MKKALSLFAAAAMFMALFAGCAKKPESVTISSPEEIAVGETALLVTEILPEDAKDKTLVFTSSDETIATVDELGNLTAVKAGAVTITAKTVNGLEATTALTVFVPVDSIKADTALSLKIGETLTLSASAMPKDATYKELEYTCSDSKIATVDKNGVITALAAGEIEVTTKAAHNGKLAKTAVTVLPVPVSITLDNPQVTLTVGGSAVLTATILPDTVLDAVVTWESNDSATVQVENGVLTAVKAGTATITAATDNGLTATCKVTVNAPAPLVNKNTGSGTKGSTATGGGTTTGGGGTTGGTTGGGGTPAASAQLTDAQIEQAIGEAMGYAGGLGFVATRNSLPGHSVGVTAGSDYNFFVSNLRENVDYIYSLVLGDGVDPTGGEVGFIRDGRTVYVTYG